jgi:potassium efflux system protein
MLAGVLALALCLGLWAEEAAPAPETALPPDLPTSDQLEAKIRDVEAAKQIVEALKLKVLEGYRLAASQLEAARGFAAKEVGYLQAARSAPQETVRIREEIKKQSELEATVPTEDELSRLKPAELEARILQAQADVVVRRGNLKDLDAAIAEQQGRPRNLQTEQVAALQQIAQIEKELAVPASPDEPAMLTDARLAALRARKHARTLEGRALEQENVTFGARLEVLKARRELTSQRLTPAESGLKELQGALDTARQMEASKVREAAEGARREALGMPPAVQALARETADLGTELAQITERTTQAMRQADAAHTQRTRSEADAKSIREKLATIGMTSALAQLLFQQRRALPDLRQYRSNSVIRHQDLAELGLRQFHLEQKYGKKTEVRADLEEILHSAGTKEAALAISPLAEDLLRKRAELAEKLIQAFADCRQEIVRLDSEERQLIQEAEANAAYIDEQLLWVPNVPPVGAKSRAELRVALGWFLDPGNWFACWRTIQEEATGRPLSTSLVLLGFGTFVLFHGRLRRRNESTALRVGKVFTDSFALTLEALLILFVRAAAWSLPLWYVGWLLTQGTAATDFARAVGAGFYTLSFYLMAFIWARATLAAGGLGPAHLRWSDRVTGLLRRHVTWLGLILLPCMFIVFATGWEGTPPETDTLGRVAYFCGMLALFIFALRVLRPASGLFDRWTAGRTHAWLWSFRYLWYPLVVAVPLALATLASLGYYFTALTLGVRLLQTVGVIVAAVVLHGLILRWFLVARAQLAIQKARENYLASAAAQGAKMEGVKVNLETLDLKLEDIDEQIRKLLAAFIWVFLVVGLWIVWDAVFPGLRVLREVSLWSYSETIGGQPILKTVSLAEALLSALIAVFTLLAARNLPALLEITVLRHFGMEAGSRFAFTTLCRYAIVAVGVVAALQGLGVGWGQVQWLVAALSLGLGFGLQEIVANLVSGIMILFERPYRVGDVVTVGDMTGVVSRIRIRATTLVDWDHREVIIPNKAFITDRLVNWTLSDPITRLVLKVGIAYGSDPSRAQAIMLATVRAHPLVLPDPAPGVFFVGLGPSSLDFEVRVFVKRIDDRMPVLHELNTALIKALAENGIEVPLPRQDLNIRSIPASFRLEPNTTPPRPSAPDAPPAG